MPVDRTDAVGRVIQLGLLLEQDMDRGMARHGLTRSRAPVVWYLAEHGALSQRELADLLQVSARNVTGLVDALESTGFVAREPHPTDRRKTLVTLTRRGRRTAAAMSEELQEFADAVLGPMSDRQLRAFVAGLDVVVGRLQEALADAPGPRR